MKINTNKDCALIIYDDIQYPIAKKNNVITYKDSISLYIIQKHMISKNTDPVLYSEIFEHSYTTSTADKYVLIKNYIPTSTIDQIDSLKEGTQGVVNNDGELTIVIENRPSIEYSDGGGWYTIYHIIIPTDEISNRYLPERDYIPNRSIDTDVLLSVGRALRAVDPGDPNSGVDYDDDISTTPSNDPTPEATPEGTPEGGHELDPDAQGHGNNNNNLETNTDDTPTVNLYYKDGKIFRENEQISNEEIITLVENGSENIYYNFEFEKEDFFIDCFLKKCYMDLCRQIFNSTVFDRCFTNKVNSQLIYKRDLVWAALNTINFMIEQGDYAGAQTLLELINGCNGLCSNDNGKGRNNCGCNGM